MVNAPIPDISRAASEPTGLRPVCLIGVERSGIANLPDLTGRVLLALASVGTDVLLMSQSSSAASCCAAIPLAQVFAALDALRRELDAELDGQAVLRLWARTDVLLVRLPHHALGVDDVAACCERLAAAGLNILSMQGGRDGVSLIVETADSARVLKALRDEGFSQAVAS